MANTDTKFRSLALDLTRKYFPCTLAIGKTVKHPDGRTVKIIDGQYMGEHGLSNFWYWREVKKGGKLGKKEHGYGW